MNTKQTLLVLALSSVLVACGSGSSQGTSTPSKADTNTTQGGKTDNSTTDNGTTDNGTTDNGTTDGGNQTVPITGVLIGKDSTTGKLVWANLSENTNINTVTINGTPVDLLPANYNKKDFYTVLNDEGKRKMIVSGVDYLHTRFGVVDTVETWGTFAQGKATDNMPTSGSATYTGRALGAIEGISARSFVTGDSEFTVKFGAEKSVHGKLNNWEVADMPDLEFDAKINGNSFEGNGAKGKFFGPNAAELGGVLNTTHNGKAVGGSFGAIKDKK